MVTRRDLEEMLAPPDGPTIRKYGYLIPRMEELYHLGLTMHELEILFPVSSNWIRAQFGEDFEYRGKGIRSRSERPTPDQVIECLECHGLTLGKLSKMKRTPPKVSKKAKRSRRNGRLPIRSRATRER